MDVQPLRLRAHDLAHSTPLLLHILARAQRTTRSCYTFLLGHSAPPVLATHFSSGTVYRPFLLCIRRGHSPPLSPRNNKYRVPQPASTVKQRANNISPSQSIRPRHNVHYTRCNKDALILIRARIN